MLLPFGTALLAYWANHLTEEMFLRFPVTARLIDEHVRELGAARSDLNELPMSANGPLSRPRDGGKVPFTEAELAAMRGGLTAEEYRWKMIRKWMKR